jgi:predicted nucleic acid-binding protein
LAAARLSASDVGDILDAVSSVCTPVHLAFLWRPLLRDANDDMVLETAINGAADQLITFNQRDFRPALQLFALAIKTPGEALRELEAKR